MRRNPSRPLPSHAGGGCPKRRRGRFRFAIFGDEEEETDPADAMPEEEPEIEDYTNPEDASSVRAEIAGNLRSLLLRLLVTGAVGLLLFFFALSTQLGWGVTASMSLSSNPIVYLTVNNALLLFALLFPGEQSPTAFPPFSICKAIRTAPLRLRRPPFSSKARPPCGRPPLCRSGPAFLRRAGGLRPLPQHPRQNLSGQRVRKTSNSSVLPTRNTPSSASTTATSPARWARGSTLKSRSSPTHEDESALKLLELSYAPDPSEKAAHNAAPIGMLCSLAVGIVSFIVSKDLFSALTAFAAAACICVPMACVLAINVPIRRLCKRALRMGAMLIGYPAVQHFGDTTALVLDAEELFPAGSVVLHGMKTFGGQRVDDVILDAAAVICSGRPRWPASLNRSSRADTRCSPRWIPSSRG